jgi:hypothetical protein
VSADLLSRIRETLTAAGTPGRRLVWLPLDGGGALWWRIRPVDPFAWRAYLPGRDRTGAERTLARIPEILAQLGEEPLPRDFDGLVARFQADPAGALAVAVTAVEGLAETTDNQRLARRLAALCEGVEAIAETAGGAPGPDDWLPLRYVRDPTQESAPEVPTDAAPLRLAVGTLSESVADWLSVQVRAASGEAV